MPLNTAAFARMNLLIVLNGIEIAEAAQKWREISLF